MTAPTPWLHSGSKCGLGVRPNHATPEQATARGRVTAPARGASVDVMPYPSQRWTCTEPDDLRAAAVLLETAADWLENQ